MVTYPQQRHLLSHRLLLIAPLLIVAGIAGCGESGARRFPVSGSVKLDGKPVEQGSIMFVPLGEEAIPSAGGKIEAGEYTLPAEYGPAVGKYRIEIHWPKPTGKKVAMGSPAPPGTMVDEVREAIPAKYNVKSKLERDVTSGENTIDLDLES
ncbi:MAG: hypothetical protein V4719_12280 [Planctomycetota bacterium]